MRSTEPAGSRVRVPALAQISRPCAVWQHDKRKAGLLGSLGVSDEASGFK